MPSELWERLRYIVERLLGFRLDKQTTRNYENVEQVWFHWYFPMDNLNSHMFSYTSSSVLRTQFVVAMQHYVEDLLNIILLMSNKQPNAKQAKSSDPLDALEITNLKSRHMTTK